MAVQMLTEVILLILSLSSVAVGQPGKCDQTPPQTTVLTPSENKGIFKMSIDTKGNSQNLYLPDQTYVLILETLNRTHPFRRFMLTAEDPEVDNSNEFFHRAVDVGSLKTLDTDHLSRYSERCYNSIENTDNSDKYRIEIHWVAPKQSVKKQRVRLRAMIAENDEVWYTGDELTKVLDKDDRAPIDSPPTTPVEVCGLCSEARYEVIFQGTWSRLTHPRHYPSKPDENFFSHMIGASHGYNFTLWRQGTGASAGLKDLAEKADIARIERDIIDSMSVQDTGTRTLIRGKKRVHPHMAEPSHSLFRVDRIHHMFSLVVAMQPSPDWFLGTSRFELCTEDGWLEKASIFLYPWDAGTVDGISYESPKSMTNPVDLVERVAVGSFNRESPFYQMNLIDLKPFAKLTVNRLGVYPLRGVDCSESKEETKGIEEENNEEEGEDQEGDSEDPKVAESRQNVCQNKKWTDWSDCVPDNGVCGVGNQVRTQIIEHTEESANVFTNYKDGDVVPVRSWCGGDQTMQSQRCFVICRRNEDQK